MPGKVEVGMVGQIDKGWFGSDGCVDNVQNVLIGQFVGHLSGHLPRVVLLTVRAYVC